MTFDGGAMPYLGTPMSKLFLDATQFFTCGKCQRKYRWKAALQRHVKYECGKEAQFFCSVCSYRAKHKSSLLRHMTGRHALRPPFSVY
ncbi:hypothetical protein GE061_003371 [Apolygus lucorum]|uniref:C2H2-type domain-containing protein n=1 Tax=Apolygus lucorum TaxID=248454 RepID=A0A8S9X1Z4_APOLU|nr:hypothetical protein GE061_003371 [Apolygus lucorum]